MDACIYNSESKKLLTPELAGTQSMLSSLKKEKYEAAIHLHYASVLSILKNHEDSLKHAQLAFKKILICMKICYSICADHLSRHNKLMSTDSIRKRLLKHPQYNLIESPHYQGFHKLVNQSFPFLQYFHNKYHATSSTASKSLSRAFIREYYSDDDWVRTAALQEITTIQPLNPLNLNNSPGIHNEVSKESMVNKLALVIASMFVISTEIKFSVKNKEEAKAWHKRTVQCSSELLPKDSLLVSQISESFTKEYNTFEIFHRKKRSQLVSSRLQTPLPPSSQKRSIRHHSQYADPSRAASRTPIQHLKGPVQETKPCPTPQPRPATSHLAERKRSKNSADDSRLADSGLNTSDLY
jgi:hypothetical protein